jgi:hypothetical protein
LTSNATSTQWTGTIPTTGIGSATWSAGTKTFTVLGVDTPASPTFTAPAVLTCALGTATVGPSSSVVRTGGAANGPLTGDLTISVGTTGNCTGVSLSVNTGVTTQTITLTSSGTNTWTGTVLRGAYSWTTGAHDFAVNAAGTPNTSGTIPFTVITAPCAVSGGSTSPGTAYRMSASAGQRRLASSVSVSVSTTGTCATVDAVIGTGGPSSVPLSLSETAPGSGVWQSTLAWNAANDWTAGNKAFLLAVNGSTVPATIPMTVQDAACTVTSASIVANPTTRSTTTRLLSAATVLTVNTTGTCSLTTNVATGRTNQNGVAMTQAAASSWTLDLRALGLQWNSGSYTETVQNNATTIRTITLTVN